LGGGGANNKVCNISSKRQEKRGERRELIEDRTEGKHVGLGGGKRGEQMDRVVFPRKRKRAQKSTRNFDTAVAGRAISEARGGGEKDSVRKATKERVFSGERRGIINSLKTKKTRKKD